MLLNVEAEVGRDGEAVPEETPARAGGAGQFPGREHRRRRARRRCSDRCRRRTSASAPGLRDEARRAPTTRRHGRSRPDATRRCWKITESVPAPCGVGKQTAENWPGACASAARMLLSRSSASLVSAHAPSGAAQNATARRNAVATRPPFPSPSPRIRAGHLFRLCARWLQSPANAGFRAKPRKVHVFPLISCGTGAAQADRSSESA